MAQNPNIDPRTGAYHADPMWRRYDPSLQQPQQPLSDVAKSALDKLKGLLSSGEPKQQPTLSPTVNDQVTLTPPTSPPLDINPGAQPIPPPPSYQNGQVLGDAFSRPQGISVSGAAPSTPTNAISTLLSGSGRHANDPIQLAGLQESRLDEMRHNLGNRGDGFGTGANDADLASLTQHVTENPYTELGRRAEEERRAAIEKMQIPLHQAEITGKYDVQRQEMVNQGALSTQKLKNQGAEDSYNNLLGMLHGGQIAPGTRIGMPGGASFTQGHEAPVPTKALDTYNRAKLAYETALKNKSWYDSDPTNERAVMDNARNVAIMSDDRFDPDLKAYALQILSNEEASKLPLDTILQRQNHQLDPQDHSNLDIILKTFRGF